MVTPRDILLGVVLPFIVAGALLKLPGLIWRAQRWPGPLAIGSAFVIGFGCLEGKAHLFPPTDAVSRLFYIGLLFTVVGVIDATIRLPTWLRPILIFAATWLGARFLLQFKFTNQDWDAVQGAVWIAGIGIVGAIWWSCFEITATEGGVLMPLGAMFVLGIGGLVVMLVADQTVGQALGAAAVALAAAAGVVAWFKEISFTRGTSAVIAGVGITALAAAYFVSGVPITDLTLIAIAPLLLTAGHWLPLKNRRPWLRVVIRLLPVLVPVGIALALAIAQFRAEQAEGSSDPYSMGTLSASFATIWLLAIYLF